MVLGGFWHGFELLECSGTSQEITLPRENLFGAAITYIYLASQILQTRVRRGSGGGVAEGWHAATVATGSDQMSAACGGGHGRLGDDGRREKGKEN